MTPTGIYKCRTRSDLMRVLDVLTRTRGVLNFHVSNGGVSYTHQPWAEVDLLPPPPDILATSWEDQLGRIDLQSYDTGGLLEGVVHGWDVMRRKFRYSTHLCVWSRREFLRAAFPGSSWIEDTDLDEEVYGMQLVDMGGVLSEGVVILCGGRVFGGDIDRVDMGLVIRRK